eukprot:gene29107-38169_t
MNPKQKMIDEGCDCIKDLEERIIDSINTFKKHFVDKGKEQTEAGREKSTEIIRLKKILEEVHELEKAEITDLMSAMGCGNIVAVNEMTTDYLESFQRLFIDKGKEDTPAGLKKKEEIQRLQDIQSRYSALFSSQQSTLHTTLSSDAEIQCTPFAVSNTINSTAIYEPMSTSVAASPNISSPPPPSIAPDQLGSVSKAPMTNPPEENFIFVIKYTDIMSPLANVANALFNAAYSSSYKKYPDKKLLDTWVRAVKARERAIETRMVKDDDEADKLVREALSLDAWLPKRYVCALSYPCDLYKYPVPRIEYEAVAAYLDEKDLSIDKNIATLVKETCSDGFPIETKRWSYCKRFRKDCCSYPTYCFYITDIFKLCNGYNSKRDCAIEQHDKKDFIFNDVTRWDAPKWFYPLMYWPQQKNRFNLESSFFRKRKFSDTTDHPLLLKHKAILKIAASSNNPEESISSLAERLNELRNKDAHNKSESVSVIALVVALQLLKACELFAIDWGKHHKASAETIKSCCEAASKIIESKEPSSSTNICCDWWSFYKAVGRYEHDTALRVLVCPPMYENCISALAIPAAPWDVVVDFTEEMQFAGESSLLWQTFKAAETQRCEAGVVLNSTSILYPDGLDGTRDGDTPWMQPLISSTGRPMPNCFKKDGQPAYEHQSHYEAITGLLSKVESILRIKNTYSIKRSVNVVIPLFGRYAMKPRREGTSDAFGHDSEYSRTNEKSFSFTAYVDFLLRKLLDSFKGNLNVLLLTAVPSCFEYLTEAMKYREEEVWPVKTFLGNGGWYLKGLSVAYCSIFDLDLAYISSVMPEKATVNNTMSTGGCLIYSGSGNEQEQRLFCNTTLQSNFKAESSEREFRLEQSGLQLLHSGLPAKSLTVYEGAEYSYATFLKNDTSTTEISLSMKLAAIEFACGNQPKWAIVANGRSGSVYLMSKQERRYAKVISDMRDIWSRATEKSSINEWLYIFNLLHNSREGATTLMMQLGWEHFFVTHGAAVLHMKDNQSKDFKNLEEDLMLLFRITNPHVSYAKKTPIVLLADRTISNGRIKQVIDIVAKHNYLSPKEMIPLFIVRISFAVSREANLLFSHMYTETKSISPPSTERDLVEVDDCVGNILQILRPNLSREQIKQAIQKLKESNCIRDEPRFSYLRGMILFKTLGQKEVRAKFKADLDTWIEKLTIKVYQGAENSPDLRSLLHTLCYVALAQFSVDNFSGVPTRLLLNFLNDPEEKGWMFSNHKVAEEYLLKRAHNNSLDTCLQYLAKGSLTAGYSMFPFPVYPVSAAKKVDADAEISSKSDTYSFDEIQLDDILLYNKGCQASGRGRAQVGNVQPVGIGASECNDFVDTAKKLLFLEGEENFWYEALVVDKNCLKFNAVFLEPFLRCALLQEALKDPTLTMSPLRNPDVHSHRFYYCVIKLLFSIIRDETSMVHLQQCLSKKHHVSAPAVAVQVSNQEGQKPKPPKKAANTADKDFEKGLAFLAIKILTSRQIEIMKLPNSTSHNLKKFSKVIGEVVGGVGQGYALNNASNLMDIFDCGHGNANAIMLFFIAQSVYHNLYALSTVTVRFIHLLLNASTESIEERIEDERKAKDIQRLGEILFAVAASHCYNAFYCDESIGDKKKKAGALVLLGNTGRYLIRQTGRVFALNLLSISVSQPHAVSEEDAKERELLDHFFRSLWRLMSLANMAKYWYEVSLHIYDQSYAVSDEAHMWVELMEYFLIPVFGPVSESVRKKLRAALFDVLSKAENDNESTIMINKYLESWKAFYSYQDNNPTNEISVSHSFEAKDFRVFTMSDVLSVLASKSLDLSTILLQSNLDPTYVIYDCVYEGDGYESTKTAVELLHNIQIKQRAIVQFVTDASFVTSNRDALHFYLELYDKINSYKTIEKAEKDEKDDRLSKCCVDIVSSAMRCWYCSSEDSKLGEIYPDDVKRVLDAILYCMEKLKYEERMMKIYIEISSYGEQLLAVDHVFEKLHCWDAVASAKNKLIVKRYESICHFHRIWGEFEGKRDKLYLTGDMLMKVDRLEVSTAYALSVNKIRELNGYYDSKWITGILKTEDKNIFMVDSENARKSDDLIFVYPAKSDLNYIPLTVHYRRRLKNDSESSSQQMQLFGKVLATDVFEGRRRGVVALIGGFQGVQLPFSNKVGGTTDWTEEPEVNLYCSLCVSFWSRGISAIDVKVVDEETVRKYILNPSSYRPKICWASLVGEGLCGMDFISTAQNLTDLADSKQKEFLSFLEKFKFARSGENQLLQDRISTLHFASFKGDFTRNVAPRASVAFDYHLKTLFGPCEVTFSVYWLFSSYLSVWISGYGRAWDNSEVSPESINETENLNSFNGLMVVFDNVKRRLVAAKEGIVVVRKNPTASKSADIGILHFSKNVPKSCVVSCLERIHKLAVRTRVLNPHPFDEEERSRSFSLDIISEAGEEIEEVRGTEESTQHILTANAGSIGRCNGGVALKHSTENSAETTGLGNTVGCDKYTPEQWTALTANTTTKSRKDHPNSKGTDANSKKAKDPHSETTGAGGTAVGCDKFIQEPWPSLNTNTTTKSRKYHPYSKGTGAISNAVGCDTYTVGRSASTDVVKLKDPHSETKGAGGTAGRSGPGGTAVGCDKNAVASTSNQQTLLTSAWISKSSGICTEATAATPSRPHHQSMQSSASQQHPVPTSVYNEKLISKKPPSITDNLDDSTVESNLSFLLDFRFTGGSPEFQGRITELLRDTKRISPGNVSDKKYDYHVKTISGPSFCPFSITWFYSKYLSLWVDNCNHAWTTQDVAPSKLIKAEEKIFKFDGLMVIFDNTVQKLVAVQEGILVLNVNKNPKLADIGILSFSSKTPYNDSCVEKMNNLAKRIATLSNNPAVKSNRLQSPAIELGNSRSFPVTFSHSGGSIPSNKTGGSKKSKSAALHDY